MADINNKTTVPPTPTGEAEHASNDDHTYSNTNAAFDQQSEPSASSSVPAATSGGTSASAAASASDNADGATGEPKPKVNNNSTIINNSDC